MAANAAFLLLNPGLLGDSAEQRHRGHAESDEGRSKRKLQTRDVLPLHVDDSDRAGPRLQ